MSYICNLLPMNNVPLRLLNRVLICCSIAWSVSCSSPSGDMDLKAVETALETPVDYGKDTVALDQQVGTLYRQAEEESDALLLWAYYLRMADGYSIAHDGVNDRSDAFFQKAQAIAAEINRPALLLVTNIRNGYYLFTYRKISEAIPYFMHASTLLDESDLRQVPQLVRHMDYLAQFFSYIGDHKKAVTAAERGLQFASASSRQEAEMYNAMAVYLKRDNKPEEAVGYFSKALEVARQAKDTVWVGIVLGNLADMKYQNGEVEEAITDLKQNIAYSIQYGEHLDAMRALINLSEMYVNENRYVQAKDAVQQAIPYIEEKPYFLVYKLKVSKLLAKIAQYEGDWEVELAQLNRVVRLQEAIAKREDAEHLQRSYWRWKQERDQNALAAMADLKRRNQIYLRVGLFILFLMTVIGGLLIGRYRQRLRTRTLLLEKKRMEETLERQQMGEEIAVLRSSLDEFTNTLRINYLVIQKLKEENSTEKDNNFSESLENLLDSHLMTDTRWLKFKAIFDRVHHGYLAELKRQYPQLTEHDLRIIALQKLELSNRSMGDILGISVDGVKKAKQRLKKKLDVDIYQDADVLERK